MPSLNKWGWGGGEKSKSVKLAESSCLIFGVNTTHHWLNYKEEKQLFDLSREQKIVGQLCFGTSRVHPASDILRNFGNYISLTLIQSLEASS